LAPKAASSRRAGLLASLLAMASPAPAADLPVLPEGTRALPRDHAELAGWSADRMAEAWPVFHTQCRHIAGRAAPLRAGVAPPAALERVCAAALALPAGLAEADVRAFLGRWFLPVEIVPPSGAGFLTGYYEPEVAGSLAPAAGFTAPLLAKPDDLVPVPPGESLPGLPEGLSAGRRDGDLFIPYPTRAEIEAGPPDAVGQPLVWLRDPVEVFMMQVQGSGRVRLPDGRVMRVAYAGRNGHPYTSVGRAIVERGLAPPEQLTLEPLKAFLREDTARGRELMWLNRSYVFFRHAAELPEDKGPIGGAGLPLTPWRSIAVDRTLWPYGLPVWMEVDLPLPDGTTEPFRRLVIAEDTGSAIVGPARADLYHGSGEVAGRRAGALRHPMRFTVLWPRREPLP
jgi:membrane-bound lytic murein transglycosylase A